MRKFSVAQCDQENRLLSGSYWTCNVMISEPDGKFWTNCVYATAYGESEMEAALRAHRIVDALEGR